MSRSALLLLSATLLSTAAGAAVPEPKFATLHVDLLANGLRFTCAASAAEAQLAGGTLSFACVDGVRFRCRRTAVVQYDTSLRLFAGNCDRLTEWPLGVPGSALIFAAGAEG